MTVRRSRKQFYVKANRHKGECYHAVLDRRSGSRALAYLKVNGTRERLIYRSAANEEEVALTDPAYVLSPHFAGDYLFWVEQCGGKWQLRAVTADHPSPDRVFEPFAVEGRPRGLASCSAGNTTLLVWEERQGKQTRIRAARISDGEIGQPVDVTDGAFNAYDPVCSADSQGRLFVVFSAFVQGQYRVFVQPLNRELEPEAEKIRISEPTAACIRPSICASRSGGLWFCYTVLGEGGGNSDAYLQHLRFSAQHRFFGSGILHAGLLKGDRTYGVLAPAVPGEVQGFMAAGRVHTSGGAGHGHLFEDPDGRLRILLRRHARIDPIPFDQDDPLEHRSQKGNLTPNTNHPAIALITLNDRAWSPPELLVPRAHIESPLSFSLEDGGVIRVAFTEDGRHTGWSRNGEWFDAEGQVGVGVAEVGLDLTGAPDYAFRPLCLRPTFGPSIEDPAVPDKPLGKHIHAVGQTHTHTNLSVCVRQCDQDCHWNYRFSQDVQHSDFCGTTDHPYNMWHTEMLLTRKFAEYYYFPGAFVAFPAYEWTGSNKEFCGHEGGPWGHVNPLWLEEEGDLPFYTPVDPTCPGGSLPRLWEAYRGKNIVTPPHHVADKLHPYFWNFFEPLFEPVVEIFQDLRGSGEKPWGPGLTNFAHREQGHWAVNELKKGKRFGFIAGGDHGGIARAGILVTDLTRTGLYEAMMARRCFATTATALKLLFTCNGEVMGSEVATEKGAFRVQVLAPEPIRELQIVRNGEDERSVPIGRNTVDHRWEATREVPGEFWYCRVLFENGEIAWSSPIWLVE